jgi:cardiolipin synthase
MLRYIPNILTALRMVAAPATAWFLLLGNYAVALAIFAFAGISDAADGFLAKRYGLGTRFGRILDPAADKVLMLAAFGVLAYRGDIPFWLTALVIGRDVFIVLGIVVLLIAGAPVRIAPLPIGKLSTALQVLYIAAHLASAAFAFSLETIVPWDAYALGLVTLLSAFSYAWTGSAPLRAPARRADVGA